MGNCRDCPYAVALQRIASPWAGEFSIYDGEWIQFTREDFTLLAHMALNGKPLVDAKDLARARKAVAEEAERLDRRLMPTKEETHEELERLLERVEAQE